MVYLTNDDIEYLVVAGGGSAGVNLGGGGGAGGLRTNVPGVTNSPGENLTAPTYTVSVAEYTVVGGGGGDQLKRLHKHVVTTDLTQNFTQHQKDIHQQIELDQLVVDKVAGGPNAGNSPSLVAPMNGGSGGGAPGYGYGYYRRNWQYSRSKSSKTSRI